jgi:hypothetical protein
MATQNTTVKQLKQAQKALQTKDYHRARQILTPLDHPKAEEWLAKVNDMELKKFRKAGELSKAGERDRAIALLQTISHPKAAQTLEKLGIAPVKRQLSPEQKPHTDLPVPTKRRKSTTTARAINLNLNLAPPTDKLGATYEWITDDHKFGFVMVDNIGVYSIDRRNDNLDVDETYLEIHATKGKRIKGRKFHGEDYHHFVGEYLSPNELYIQLPGLTTGRLWWKREVSYRFKKIDLDVRLYHPRISAVLLAVCWAIAFVILPEYFTNVDLLPFLGETRPILEVQRAIGLFLFVLPLMYMRTMIPLIRRCWRVVTWRVVSLTVFILLIPTIIAAFVYFVMALVVISVVGVAFKFLDWNEVDEGTGYENGQRFRYYSMQQGCMSVVTGYLAQIAWYIAGGLGLLLIGGTLNLIPSLFPQRVSVSN